MYDRSPTRWLHSAPLSLLPRPTLSSQFPSSLLGSLPIFMLCWLAYSLVSPSSSLLATKTLLDQYFGGFRRSSNIRWLLYWRYLWMSARKCSHFLMGSHISCNYSVLFAFIPTTDILLNSDLGTRWISMTSRVCLLLTSSSVLAGSMFLLNGWLNSVEIQICGTGMSSNSTCSIYWSIFTVL